MSKAAFSGLFLPLHLLLLQYSIRICRSSKLRWFSKYIIYPVDADQWLIGSLTCVGLKLKSTSHIAEKTIQSFSRSYWKLGNTTNESWTVRTDLSVQENGAANYQQYSNYLLRKKSSRLTRAMERTPNISVVSTLNLQIRYLSPPTHKQQQQKKKLKLFAPMKQRA